MQAHEAGNHIVFQSLLLRFAILLPAGNDFLDTEFDPALDFHRVRNRQTRLALPPDGYEGVLAGAHAGLRETFVHLRQFASLQFVSRYGVVPPDLEWPRLIALQPDGLR